MYETLHLALAPYYLYIKMVHVPAAFLWFMSVLSGYSFFLVPVMQAWRRNQDDPGHTEMRNWVFERFDVSVSVEHVAYPLVMISGALLFVAGGWDAQAGWLILKLAIVFIVTVPMEAFDYYISHLNGNKRYLRDRDGKPDWERYETAMHTHWWFFLVTTPPIGFMLFSVIFLAFTKPF
ncbi:hypothetical protein EY643_06855 [Halioglobus maricola]|uniref:DUF2269 domain-containing protein n=1 Tax=Halioglobus maricola TaxID=2601894 RepID=A0A5P9NHX2_9GAMM|nr:hypothetical protein [Halioglobus maricola]QFU75392.1 hypothetical protein EY643_06855 [Halioglobus maricola]